MSEIQNCLFIRNIAAIGLKIGRSSQLNEFIKLNEYQKPKVIQIFNI